MRIYAGIVLAIAFFGWTLYRLLIKKDLKKNLPAFYMGVFFMAVWGLIYWAIMSV